MKRIDMEAHVYTEDYIKYLKTRRKPPYDEIKGQYVSRWLTPELETHLSEELDKILCDIGNGRIKDMDAAGIDTQVLSLTVPGGEQFEGSEGTPIAQEVNDYLSE